MPGDRNCPPEAAATGPQKAGISCQAIDGRLCGTPNLFCRKEYRVDFDQIHLRSEFMDIRKRFSRMERRYRRLQWSVALLTLLTVVAAALGLWRQTRGEVIDAQAVVLRDRFGQVVAELRANDQLAELALFGPKGTARLLVHADRTAVVLEHQGQRRTIEAP